MSELGKSWTEEYFSPPGARRAHYRSREVPVGHAYAGRRASWLTVGVDDIREAAERRPEDIGAWQHRGMAMVDGRRPGGAATGSQLERLESDESDER